MVVGKFATLWEPWDTFDYFEVDPSISRKLVKVVLLDEFLGDVGEFDLDILWAVHWSTQVKNADVKACKPGSFVGEDTVKHELD